MQARQNAQNDKLSNRHSTAPPAGLAPIPKNNAPVSAARGHDTAQRFLRHAVHEAHVPVLAGLQELEQTVVALQPRGVRISSALRNEMHTARTLPTMCRAAELAARRLRTRLLFGQVNIEGVVSDSNLSHEARAEHQVTGGQAW